MKSKLFLLILLPIIHGCITNPTSLEKDSDYLVIFTSDRDSDGSINIEMGTKCDIYTMFIDGSNVKRLTNNNRYNDAPVYSSNGQYIVFTSSLDWLMDYIHIINSDGTNEIELGGGKHPIFSNDNTKILCQTGGVIGLMDIDGNSQVFLTNWTDSIYSNLGQDFPVQFSSDDSTILYYSYSIKNNNSDIYTMSINGTNVQRLTSDPANDRPYSYSNDDSKILFRSDRTGTSQIYIMDSDGKNKKQLTFTESFNIDARFSPDGNKIVFRSNRDGTSEVYLMNSDGTNQTRLSYTNSIKDNAMFTPDGKYILYSGKEIDNLNENKYNIFSIDIKNGRSVNITNNAGNNFVSSFSPIFK